MNALNFDDAYFRSVIAKSPLTKRIPTVNELLIEGTQKFYDEFDYYPNSAACAPGTFTIMGEYMELAGGLIVQAALPLVTLVLSKTQECMKCRAVTCLSEMDQPNRIIFPVAKCRTLKKGFPKWANLLKGVTNIFLQSNTKGFDVLINSSVPVSRGFGSSSALETAFYVLLECHCNEKSDAAQITKAKRCKIADEKFGDSSSGSFSSYASLMGESKNAVVLNSGDGTVKFLKFRDPNILFLITIPSGDLLQQPEKLIRMRETELKLAAKLLDLEHIKHVEECHLEVLASMDDPSRQKVTAILREFETDEDYISEFVEEFFKLPQPEVELGESDVEYPGENYGFDDLPSRLQDQIWTGESLTIFEYKTVCNETVCLGGLSDLSKRSDLTVMSKLFRRVRYIITENMRIRDMIRYVTDLDFVSAGMQMTRSHLSLKVDFEVSSPAMDELVEFTAEFGNGVFGSKMMRNGSTLTLLHRNEANNIIQSIKDKFGNDFEFYLVFPCRGARRIKLIPPSIPKSLLSDSYLTVEDLLKKSVENFEATYHRYPTHGSYAPGSVKLLGDHSDYNQTYCLPMALNMVTFVVGALNGSGKIRVATTEEFTRQPQKVIFQIPSVSPIEPGYVKWANYVRGVINYFKGPVPGFDCLIETSVPMANKISSSASLQIAMYSFLEELTGHRTEDENEKAGRCMKAEHDYTYTLCGIDDFIVALKGCESKMLLIDCKRGMFTYLPAFDPSLTFLLIFLVSYIKPSKSVLYMRLEECYDVAKALGKTSLRCAREEDLKNLKGVSNQAVKRARHVITEEKRVLDGAEALRNYDAEKFGRLMVQSHISLRDNFEVSTHHVDDIVERSLEVDGVLGARMTGSEYGTSVICLVKRWAVDDLITHVREECPGSFKFYLVTPSDGPQHVDIAAYLESLPGPKRTFETVFQM